MLKPMSLQALDVRSHARHVRHKRLHLHASGHRIAPSTTCLVIHDHQDVVDALK